MKKSIVLISIILFHTHSKSPAYIEKEMINSRFYTINYENLLKNKRMVYLSQIASDVKYIPLETNPSCLINQHQSVKFFLTDRWIFVQNVNHVLKFSVDGRFINKIGRPGRGPGEIGIINSMSVIPDKEMIVIYDFRKLFFFSFNGDLIKTINIPFHQEVIILKDSRYLTYDPGTNGSEKYNFILANERGDTISVVKNYTTWKKTLPGSILVTNSANEATFYINDKIPYFKSKYNDTVYYFNKEKDIIEPAYLIDLGKYKVPEELIPEKIATDPIKFQDFQKRAINYFLVKPLEISNQVFIRSSCMWRRDIKYLMYDKDSKTGCSLVNENGESTGILNDWDGGVDFWPNMQNYNNQVIMPLDIFQFKEKIGLQNHSGRKIKYPNEQKSLMDLISRLDNLDNPIIMKVTLKSKF
ncbi:MAG: 6-bladed beta-propeller [Bacteroidales bacterium]|jgi:hypothetical protein